VAAGVRRTVVTPDGRAPECSASEGRSSG
jgi:hypothetical protein